MNMIAVGSRQYFPDFFLPKYNSYVEVKGYKKERDTYKWESITKIHNKKLLIIDKRIIKSIKDNSVSMDYLIDTFLY